MAIKKKILILFLLFFVSGCNVNSGNLERVIVQSFDESGQETEEIVISNDKELKELYDLVEEVEWKDSSDSLTNKNMTITFFYDIENDKPEKLVEYDVLLDDEGKSFILLNEEGNQKKLGVLNDSNSSLLQELFGN